jgi:hypothetical protein
MEDNNLKNQFSADLLGTVSSVLNTEAEQVDEKRGLWDNIHAKRKRIKKGSGERMRKPGSEGAPTAAALKASQTEETELDEDMKDLPDFSTVRKKIADRYAFRNKFKAPHDDTFKQSMHPRTGEPEAKFYHKNGMMFHSGEGEYGGDKDRWRVRFGDREKGDLDKSSNDSPRKFRTFEKAKAVLIAGKVQKEEVELDEKHGGADYALYHKSYTNAVDHALSHHAKYGVNASDDDKFHHIGLMSKKPSEGNTTTVNLPAKDHATGKDHTIHMQVYNRGGSHPYELNTYSSKNSTQRQIDKVAAKRKKALGEALIGGQAKLDVDKDGKLEKSDFKKLRNKKIAAKVKEAKDCACDDMDEAVYNGHRPTGLPPGQGLPKAQQDVLTAKLRDFDAKMDAAKKKFATKEEVELDEGRGRPPKPGSAAYIAQQKAKEAGEAEGPEPDEHIMNQVRKAADSGMMPHKIKYADGSTHALHRVHARAVISKYNRLKPFAKEDMQAEIAKSHEHMMKHAKD